MQAIEAPERGATHDACIRAGWIAPPTPQAVGATLAQPATAATRGTRDGTSCAGPGR